MRQNVWRSANAVRKRELKLALQSAGRIARDQEFFLIGSQAIHAYCGRPPAEVTLSQECDLYPKNRPETANLLDAKLGRGSPKPRTTRLRIRQFPIEREQARLRSRLQVVLEDLKPAMVKVLRMRGDCTRRSGERSTQRAGWSST